LVGSKKETKKEKTFGFSSEKLKTRVPETGSFFSNSGSKTLPANPKILEQNQIASETEIQHDPARFPFDLTCNHQKPIPAIFRHGGP
jgi:hypothetical protein